MKLASAGRGTVYAGVLFILLALQQWASVLSNRGAGGLVRAQVAQLRGRHSWKVVNGYYENLMGEIGDERKRPIELIMQGRPPWGDEEPELYRPTNFLVYEAKPNLRLVHPLEGPVKTNLYGFFDHEHSLKKSPGIIRIAVFGDSVSRGWGVSQDERFDHLLANRLNSEFGEHFEVLNFAVPGYRLSQTFDLAMETAQTWQPDVYMVTLTDLTVGPDWGDHIVQLVANRADLKYEVLRQVVKDSGLRKGDDPSLSEWKLAPYRFGVLREMLLGLKSNAEEHSAKLIVVLLPGAEDLALQKHRFRGIPDLLTGTGIPVVNLLNTFAETDLDSMRVLWYDPHPNSAGHRMIADELYRKLHEHPDAWAALTGSLCCSPPAK